MNVFIVLFILLVVFILMYRHGAIKGVAEFFFVNIVDAAVNNNSWRKVMHTSDNMQTVVMSVPVGHELGWEVHGESDQLFRIEQGEGEVHVSNDPLHIQYVSKKLKDDSLVVVPHDLYHNVINTGTIPLKFYTVYSPPHHPQGIEDVTHADEIARGG